MRKLSAITARSLAPILLSKSFTKPIIKSLSFCNNLGDSETNLKLFSKTAGEG